MKPHPVLYMSSKCTRPHCIGQLLSANDTDGQVERLQYCTEPPCCNQDHVLVPQALTSQQGSHICSDRRYMSALGNALEAVRVSICRAYGHVIACANLHTAHLKPLMEPHAQKAGLTPTLSASGPVQARHQCHRKWEGKGGGFGERDDHAPLTEAQRLSFRRRFPRLLLWRVRGADLIAWAGRGWGRGTPVGILTSCIFRARASMFEAVR